MLSVLWLKGKKCRNASKVTGRAADQRFSAPSKSSRRACGESSSRELPACACRELAREDPRAKGQGGAAKRPFRFDTRRDATGDQREQHLADEDLVTLAPL